MAKEQVITTRQATPANVEAIVVQSNGDKEKTVDLATGFVRLQYYESLLQDAIRVTVAYSDTGNTIEGKTAMAGLPMVGQETTRVKFTDNNDETIDVKLYINKISQVYEDTTGSLVMLDLASKEFILNEKIRLHTRFDGKISEHIKKILSEQIYLRSEKDLEGIEDTQNNFNFIGLNKKPFYMINWLSRIAVPETDNSSGNTAGYMFWETSKGYQFKSIDKLLSQEKKKSIIYNETPDSGGENIPEGYDMKAIQYERENNINVQSKLRMGAYSTRTIMFNPFDCKYEVITPNAEQIEKEDGIKTAGKELPVLNPEFNMQDDGEAREFSRTMYMLLDTGTLPDGSGTGKDQQQLDKSQKQNYDVKNILAQSVMRYNQLFAAKCTVVLPGDFSLHAGDAIFVDAPELKTDTKNDETNKQSGGLYIIADLCHYVTPKETYTKLNLIRDSFGRKGTPTSST